MRLEGSTELALNEGEDNLSKEALIELELLKAVIENGKSFRIQAFGFSMYPFIRNKDYVTISPLTTSHPKVGDIVAFVLPGTRKLIIHRVLKINGNKYLVKGDNISWPDGQILKANIIGYVTKVEKDKRLVCFGSVFEKLFILLIYYKNIFHQILLLTYKLIGPVIRRIKA